MFIILLFLIRLPFTIKSVLPYRVIPFAKIAITCEELKHRFWENTPFNDFYLALQPSFLHDDGISTFTSTSPYKASHCFRCHEAMS